MFILGSKDAYEQVRRNMRLVHDELESSENNGIRRYENTIKDYVAYGNFDEALAKRIRALVEITGTDLLGIVNHIEFAVGVDTSKVEKANLENLFAITNALIQSNLSLRDAMVRGMNNLIHMIADVNHENEETKRELEKLKKDAKLIDKNPMEYRNTVMGLGYIAGELAKRLWDVRSVANDGPKCTKLSKLIDELNNNSHRSTELLGNIDKLDSAYVETVLKNIADMTADAFEEVLNLDKIDFNSIEVGDRVTNVDTIVITDNLNFQHMFTAGDGDFWVDCKFKFKDSDVLILRNKEKNCLYLTPDLAEFAEGTCNIFAPTKFRLIKKNKGDDKSKEKEEKEN